MRPWLLMTGGLLIWAVHFMGIYLIASVADVVDRADAFAWRMGGLAFSLACLLAAGAVGAYAAMQLRAGPGDGARAFRLRLAALGAGIGGVGVLYQALPNLIGY